MMKGFSGNNCRHCRLALILTLALTLLIPAGSASAELYTDLPSVSGAMLEAQYWIDKMADPDRTLMDGEEIRAFNQEIYAQSDDNSQGVYDLAAYPREIDAARLRSWMELDPGSGPYYLAGESSALPGEILDSAVANMGLDRIKASNPAGYAVAAERCNMKCLPIAEAVSDEPGDLEYDEFQYTVVLPGAPVRVLFESMDREWLFVQGYNCRGWVESRFLARADQAQWMEYIKARDRRFVLVAANRVVLNENPHDARLSQLALPMATRLPLAASTDIPALLDGQNPSGNRVVYMPLRDSAGKMELKLALIPGSADVRESYLPFTSANVLRQAFKTMGDRYGWGGMLNGRDCSALVMDIYACFGFSLPRNTSGQCRLRNGAVLELEGYGEGYRGQLLNALRPGAALYFPGHTMIYLGSESNRHYVISALGSYARPGKDGEMDIQRVHGTVVNDLNLKRRNGNTWMAELTEAQQFFKIHFADLDGLPEQASVESLANQFILAGTGPREFSPRGSLTRGEAAQLLMRARGWEPAPASASFLDTENHWSRGAVGAMVVNGLMQGVDEEHFQPDALVTRAELFRLAGMSEDEIDAPGEPATRLEAAMAVYESRL